MLECLNGYWDFSCASDNLNRLPDKWEERKILVPSPYNVNKFAGGYRKTVAGESIYVSGGDFRLFPEYPLHWEDAECGFYRRTLNIPEQSGGKRLFLRFDGVAFKSAFYLNGKKILEEAEAFLPIEIEITEHVIYGADNELIVGAEVASRMKYKDENGRSRLDYPQGSFWGDQIAGIWQDVYLCERPAEYISDLFAVSDVNARTLTVRYEYQGAEGARVKLTLARWKHNGCETGSGTPASFNDTPEREIISAPCDNGGGELVWRYEDGDVELWDTENPALYVLTARLCRDGAFIGETSIRIGFRSFTAEGGRFYLNGEPVNLRNDSWHYMGYSVQTEEYARAYYRMAKDAFVNIIRLHAQPFPSFFYDIADEMGMLLVSESGIWASHCNFSYNDAFFENSKRHLKRLILRDRNHPSVVMWSPENECIPAYKVCGSKYIRDVADLEDKLYELTQVIPALDGSRLISCDGSGDLNGRLPVNSLHYPGYDCPTHREKPITIGEMGSMYYSTPDTVCAELGEAALQSFNGRLEAVSGDAFHNLTGQRKWAAQICVFNLIWYGLEPLPFKDKPLVYDDYTAPGIKPSRITPYLRTLNAGAQADLPDYIPNPVFTTTREAYRPVRFFLENAPSSGFTLENLSFPVTVFNDGRGKAELRLTASLKADGVAQVEKTYPLDSCAFAEDVITLAMPGEAGEGTLVFSLYRNGEVIFSDERTVTLYDRKGLQKEYETLASNLTAAGLQSLTPETASVYAPFLKPGKLRRLFGADCGFTFNKPLDGYYFDDYLNFNAQPLFFDGNGNPVVLVIEENGNPVILSGIDLNKHSDEPQAYALRNMLARYLADNAGDFISAMPAYFYGDADGVAAAMLNELQCEYEVIGEAALRSLLNNKQDRVLIADGKTDLSWLKGISASNFKRVLIMGLTRTPDLFADAFTVTDSACCHLTGGREMKRVGLYGNNLYGLSSGVEEALASRLLCYESADNVILSAAQTDWRMWNHNAEYLKTVSILKAVKESNKNLAALSRHDYAGSAIYISQINFSTVSRKIKHITARILSSLGASLKLRENNELNELLSGGLYSNHVTGMLYRRSAEGEDAAAVNPGLNRVENGNVWGVTRERDDVNGLMALYVYSPQDRTDLLLNPDTVDMSVKAHQGKSVAVYLNGAFQTEGTMLNITSLELRAGWNLIVMKGASFPEVRFRRANLKPSDLLFGLYDNEIIKHNMTKARLESVNQPNNLIGAVSGREHHWRSSTDQHEGVDLTVKFPSPVLTRAVYFNSSTGDGREVYPPYRFKIWAGETDDALTEVYAAQFEDRMHYRQGKVFLRLDDVNASIFKIVLTDNALKPWIVSDLSFLA